MNFPSVFRKADFVRRYAAGEFGNRAPTWNTLEEFVASGYRGKVHLRNRVAGGPTWYDVEAADVVATAQRVISEGLAVSESLYYSGMAPTELTTVQGELQRSELGLALYFSRVAKPMRASLVEGGRQIYGLASLAILEHYMDWGSYDWVQVLLERYPDHVIEFSCYSKNWGTIPHRNTVIWEVRRY